jgi:hypothetical protein
MLLELVDDARLLFWRQTPAGDDAPKSFTPVIHIGLP